MRQVRKESECSYVLVFFLQMLEGLKPGAGNVIQVSKAGGRGSVTLNYHLSKFASPGTWDQLLNPGTDMGSEQVNP